jgi:hypothetical protein
LKADENTLVLDEVEWVTQESRAEELGLTQTFQDDGFCLYNPAEDGAQYSYAQACTFQLQDWSQGGGLTAVEKDVFLQTVTDRYESGLGEKIPYIVTLEKGKITDVTEQYVP